MATDFQNNDNSTDKLISFYRGRLRWNDRFETLSGARSIRFDREVVKRYMERDKKAEDFLTKIRGKYFEEIPERPEMIRRFAVVGCVVSASIFALYFTSKTSSDDVVRRVNSDVNA